jgi:hypothetical protein
MKTVWSIRTMGRWGNYFLYVHGSMHRESMSIFVQQEVTICSFIIFSADSCTCFGWYPHPSSGAHSNCNYNIWHWSNRICYRPLTWRSRNSVPQTALHVSDDNLIHHQEHIQTLITTSGTGRTVFAIIRWRDGVGTAAHFRLLHVSGR